MSIDTDDIPDTVVALVSGAIIGVIATLVFLRVQRNRSLPAREFDDEYRYDGGDLFV